MPNIPTTNPRHALSKPMPADLQAFFADHSFLPNTLHLPTPLGYRDALTQLITHQAHAAPTTDHQAVHILDRMSTTPAHFYGYNVPLRVFIPNALQHTPTQHTNVMLFFHGGGVAGSVSLYTAWLSQLAATTGQIIVAPAYRCAPENRYPAAIDDAHSVLQGLGQTFAKLNIEVGYLTVAGDGTGGAIAATLVQDWLSGRVASNVPLTGQILIDGVLDYTLSQPSAHAAPSDTYLGDSANHWAWLIGVQGLQQNYAWYFGKHDDSELASPYWTDLDSLVHYSDKPLPRCLTITAGHSPLRDENLAYHALLEQAGFTAQLANFAAMPHGFWYLPTQCAHAYQQLHRIIGQFCQTTDV